MIRQHPRAPEIIALRRDGCTYKEIQNRLRVTRGVVAGVIRRAKLSKPHPRLEKAVKVKPRTRNKQLLKPAAHNAHPLVKRLITLVNADERYWSDIAYAAGVPEYRLNDWRYHCYPNLSEIEACFMVLGRALIDVPLPLVDKP